MKKILNALLIAAMTTVVVPQIVNADETLENKSTETTGEAFTSSYVTGIVKTKLLGTKGIQSNDISVSSEIAPDGKTAVVTLTGTQNSEKSRKLAGYVAKNADKRVAKVKNSITVVEAKN